MWTISTNESKTSLTLESRPMRVEKAGTGWVSWTSGLDSEWCLAVIIIITRYDNGPSPLSHHQHRPFILVSELQFKIRKFSRKFRKQSVKMQQSTHLTSICFFKQISWIKKKVTRPSPSQLYQLKLLFLQSRGNQPFIFYQSVGWKLQMISESEFWQICRKEMFLIFIQIILSTNIKSILISLIVNGMTILTIGRHR